MFEFLFKRPGDGKPGDQPAGQGGSAAPDPKSSAPAPGPSAQRTQQAERLRQLGNDEAAAVDFLLQCEFSELRLAAAELIHRPELLERVHTAMRNTDRRVAKLVQARLDAHRHREAERRRAQAALEQAQGLLKDAVLTPNHVAELDRKWSVIAAPELGDAFGAVRAALGARLEDQVRLQRAMIDRLAALRRLAGEQLPAAELAARLDVLVQEQAAALQAPEHASLPRSLVAEFGLEQEKLRVRLQGLEAGDAARAVRSAFLDAQAARPPAELDADALRREWRALPPLPRDEALAALQQRFDALLASLPQREPARPAPPREARPAEARAQPERTRARGADQHFLDMMDAMEAALQQGSLGTAADLDKSLKEAREKGGQGGPMRLTPPNPTGWRTCAGN